jgi:hypothetical protein
MLAVSAGECKLSSRPEPGHPLAYLSLGRIGPAPECVPHEGRVALEVLDGNERSVAAGDLQHRGVYRRAGIERSGGKAASSSEPPPRRPGRAQEVERRSVVNAGAMAGNLPLHDEIGADQAPFRVVEEPVQDRRGPTKGRIRHDPVGRAGQGNITNVGVQHDDVRGGGEPSGQPVCQRLVELDGEDRRRSLGQRRGQYASAGAEVDDTVVALHAGVGDEPRREQCAIEKVLSEAASRRRTAADVPGHGTS